MLLDLLVHAYPSSVAVDVWLATGCEAALASTLSHSGSGTYRHGIIKAAVYVASTSP